MPTKLHFLSYSYHRKEERTSKSKKLVTGYYQCSNNRTKGVFCKGRAVCKIKYLLDGTENKNITITEVHNGYCVPHLNEPMAIDGFKDVKKEMKDLVESIALEQVEKRSKIIAEEVMKKIKDDYKS
jgi:hypothetical protein